MTSTLPRPLHLAARNLLALATFFATLGALTGCAGPPPSPPPSPARRDPPQDTLCRARLDEVRARVDPHLTSSLMAVRGDEVVFSFGPVERPSPVHSVRKSLLAMLYGQPVAQGRIDLDATLAQLGIDDDAGSLLPIERQARVRDVLSARSGVYHPASNPGDDTASAPPRGSQVPGTYFLYNNWDFNVAGDIFEQQTGRRIYDAFNEDIVLPLGLQDFHLADQHRQGDASRSSHLAYPFSLSARDMARIGQLMLAQGHWEGRQLVPAGWVQAITAPITPPEDMHPARRTRQHLAYGDMWWLPQEPADSPLAGAYMAWGYFGQYLLVVPKRGMVVVHKFDTNAKVGGPPVPTLHVADFLSLARTLADAPCDAGLGTGTAQ